MAAVFYSLAVTAVLLSAITSGSAARHKKKIHAQLNDEVVITCEFKKYPYFDVIRIDRESPARDQVIPVSDSDYVKPPFEGTDRYSVSIQKVGQGARVRLTIKNVRGEDQGTFLCYQLNDPSDKLVSELKVKVPLKEVKLERLRKDKTPRAISSTQTVTLKAGHMSGIQCVASVAGSLKPPHVEILVGGVDRTAMFKQETNKKQMLDQDRPTSLGSHYAETRMTYFTDDPNPELNGQSLVCAAQAEGDIFRRVNTTVHVEYKPRVTCSQGAYFAQQGGTVEVNCEVRANPAANFSWRWLDQSLSSPGSAEDIEVYEKKTIKIQKSALSPKPPKYVVPDRNPNAPAPETVTSENSAATRPVTLLVCYTLTLVLIKFLFV